MRILFLSHYFPPEVNAPATRTYEHCKVWARDGHDVTVLTCVPNHPAGRIYSGYRNGLSQADDRDGIRVRRLLTLVAANRGVLMRTLNYLFFMLMTIFAAPFIRKPDIVISTSPQFFNGLAGYFVSRLRRVPWVLEIRDLWPESIVAVGAMKKNCAIRALEKLEAFAYRKADHIVSVTDSFVPHIIGRGGSDANISVIKNGVDLSRFNPDHAAPNMASELGLEGKFVASYVGTHGMAHGLETILAAADQLRQDPSIAFLMVGDGAERDRLLNMRREMGLDNLVMLEQQPRERMPNLWAITGASLVVLRDRPVFRCVIPSKIFESMAMERPVILGVRGEARNIVEEAGGGICIEPENAAELANAVRALAYDPKRCAFIGAAARDYVAKNFNRTELARRYERILSDLVLTRGAADSTVSETRQ